MDRIAESGASEIVAVGAVRSQHSCPAARIRIIQYDDRPFDVSGTLPTFRLELTLRSTRYTGHICFPEVFGAKQFQPVGDLFLLPPGQLMRSRGTNDGRQSVVCEFEPDALRQWLGFDVQWGARAPCDGLKIESPPIRAALRRLADELAHPGFAHDTLCELLVAQAGLDLARFIEAPRTSQWIGGLTPNRLKMIEERVTQVSPPPSLGELAALCSLSVRQLTRGFRASRNCSIGDFIAHAQIENAKDLLATGVGVAEVASRLGFSSAGNFSTAFRRATGMTPRRYRSGGWTPEPPFFALSPR